MNTVLDGNAIREVTALAQAAQMYREQIGDYEFSLHPLVRVNTDPSLPPALEFYTLAAFASYLVAEAEEERPLVHVVSPTAVQAVGRLSGQDASQRRRTAVALCKTTGLRGFSFEDYYSLDGLAIALQTCFAPGVGQVESLRQFCAAVRATSSIGVDDDGVSQTVAAKRGIAAVQETGVKNPWLLAPWRTFPEVAQPLSPFVLRFTKAEGELPEAGLFETGDARWQVEAVQNVAGFLRNQLGPDWTVLG